MSVEKPLSESNSSPNVELGESGVLTQLTDIAKEKAAAEKAAAEKAAAEQVSPQSQMEQDRTALKKAEQVTHRDPRRFEARCESRCESDAYRVSAQDDEHEHFDIHYDAVTIAMLCRIRP